MSFSVYALRLIAGVLVATGNGAAAEKTVSDAEVRKVQASAILIDTHNDVTSDTVVGLDLGKPRTDGHTDIARMRQGGMGAQFFAVYVSADYVEGNRAAHRTLDMIDTVRHDIVENHPNDFVFATTADDIVRAHKRRKSRRSWGSKAATRSKTICGCCGITTLWASAT